MSGQLSTVCGPSDLPLPRQRSSWRRAVRSLLHNRLALFSGFLLLVVLIGALLAPIAAPYDPNDIDVLNTLQPPDYSFAPATHFLGTDGLGRDILSRILYGARISLLVGFLALSISTVLGVSLGLISGYFGGKVDDLLMGLADIQLAFPPILLYISVMTVLGPGLVNIILVLGISRWIACGRVVRGEALSLREKEFVLAARSIGTKDLSIILRHLLPNLLAPVIVVTSFGLSTNIIMESSLSFLGLGVPVSVPTWGAMLNDGRESLRIAWWPATMPGLAIMFAVLGINALGDWLRDFLDPGLSNDT